MCIHLSNTLWSCGRPSACMASRSAWTDPAPSPDSCLLCPWTSEMDHCPSSRWESHSHSAVPSLLRPMQDRASRTTFLPSSKTSSVSGRIFPRNSHAIPCEIIAHGRSLHRESRGKEEQVSSSQRFSGLSQGFRVSHVHSGDRCWKTQRNPRKTRSSHTSSIASWSHFPLHTNVFPASDLVLEFYVQSPE